MKERKKMNKGEKERRREEEKGRMEEWKRRWEEAAVSDVIKMKQWTFACRLSNQENKQQERRNMKHEI